MSFLTRTHANAATVLGTLVALASPGAALAADTGGAAFEPDAARARQALAGDPIAFRGTAQPGSSVAVQRLADGEWVTDATAVAGRSGRYLARWRSRRAGVFSLRALPTSGENARAAAVDEPVRVTVYSRSSATWFGRGLYGRKTACGQTLTPQLLGVAHKTLPCGTRVSFLFRGRSITVPVVDRGPFGAGLSWDLTYAAAEELDFTETGRGTVGVFPLRRR